MTPPAVDRVLQCPVRSDRPSGGFQTPPPKLGKGLAAGRIRHRLALLVSSSLRHPRETVARGSRHTAAAMPLRATERSGCRPRENRHPGGAQRGGRVRSFLAPLHQMGYDRMIIGRWRIRDLSVDDLLGRRRYTLSPIAMLARGVKLHVAAAFIFNTVTRLTLARSFASRTPKAVALKPFVHRSTTFPV